MTKKSENDEEIINYEDMVQSMYVLSANKEDTHTIDAQTISKKKNLKFCSSFDFTSEKFDLINVRRHAFYVHEHSKC